MLLVGAFALSLVFVALALLLNSAVYTENLATRNSGDDTQEAIEFSREVRLAVRGILANLESSGSDDVEFKSTMNDWTNRAERHYTADGVTIGTSVKSVDTTTYDSAEIRVTYRSTQVRYAAVIEVDRTP
ncbi:hypothetical protein BRC77_03825 [Halobacteriales archaeon QH_8_64_26]|nr:MAG: hypothetical protein BRC77_03825 [Halobacteriales archaeon QH_8_64_26]